MTATVVTSENAAEFYAAKTANPLTEDPVVAEVVAEPVVDEVVVEPDGDDDTAKQDEQKHSNPKIDKRIQVLVKQRETSQAELAAERATRTALEQRLAALEGKQEPEPPAPDANKPRPDQFTDAFEYAEALAEWKVEGALKVRDSQVAEQKAAQEREGVIKAWNERQAAVAAELPDYADMLASSDVQVSNQVRDAILESEVGPKILYHLASNPEVAEALGKKSVVSALREIGRLEATLSGEKAPAASVKNAATPSRAPAPITPIKATKVSDSPIGSDGEFHGTYAAWKEARRAGKIK